MDKINWLLKLSVFAGIAVGCNGSHPEQQKLQQLDSLQTEVESFRLEIDSLNSSKISSLATHVDTQYEYVLNNYPDSADREFWLGEVAYFGQMKSFYRCFDQQMPAIFPRLSATFIEPAIDRIMGELPFAVHQYSGRIEDLESEFVEESSQIDIDAVFDEWKQKAEATSASYKEKIIEIDQTLEGAAERAQAKYFNELDRLKGKTYKAIPPRALTVSYLFYEQIWD